jgi:tripartite ATP-independent transporter DctM subunit
MLSLILTLTFIGLMCLRVPVSFAIGLSTIIPLLAAGKSFVAIPQYMQEGVHSIALLAVPFFILAGNLFNTLGLSRRIWDFARHLVGHWKGGMGHVMVVANMIFAGISGSALADAAGLGLIGIPAMEKMGYRRPFSTAITLCSSVIGPIIPPSINFIIYGVTAEVSIGRLFLGGVVPGFIIGGCLMLMIYYYAKKGIEPLPVQPRKTFLETGKSFVRNSPTLLVPVVIVIGMGGGVITPTEVGVFAAVYALGLGLIYREATFKELVNCIKGSAKSTCLIMYIIAVSTIAGWIYSYEGTALKIAEFMLQVTTNKYLLLFLINLFLLILGCLLEPIPALILTTPIFLPMMKQLGVDPVHFGLIICYNLTIGIITPPMGIGLYVMVGIVDIKFEDLVRACLPLLIPLIASLFLITYIPELTLFLPNLIMGHP